MRTNDKSTPPAVIYGARGGPTFGPVPRTRITVNSDPGGPAYVSGRRFRRAKARAMRKGGGDMTASTLQRETTASRETRRPKSYIPAGVWRPRTFGRAGAPGAGRRAMRRASARLARRGGAA